MKSRAASVNVELEEKKITTFISCRQVDYEMLFMCGVYHIISQGLCIFSFIILSAYFSRQITIGNICQFYNIFPLHIHIDLLHINQKNIFLSLLLEMNDENMRSKSGTANIFHNFIIHGFMNEIMLSKREQTNQCQLTSYF